eukprot:5178502-Pyramimonas_sp.AAC.1
MRNILRVRRRDWPGRGGLLHFLGSHLDGRGHACLLDGVERLLVQDDVEDEQVVLGDHARRDPAVEGGPID